jgi:hypothetical protein
MRGKRQVFARGLALTLVKKLGLEGDEVWLRFFDSRLHEVVKARAGGFPVPYLLSFRSERGRNYGKVFRQLLLELTRLRRASAAAWSSHHPRPVSHPDRAGRGAGRAGVPVRHHHPAVVAGDPGVAAVPAPAPDRREHPAGVAGGPPRSGARHRERRRGLDLGG